MALQDLLIDTPVDDTETRDRVLTLGQQIAPQVWEQICSYEQWLRSNTSSEIPDDLDPFDEVFMLVPYEESILQAYLVYVEFCRQFEVRGSGLQAHLEALLEERRQVNDEPEHHKKYFAQQRREGLTIKAYLLLTEIAPEAESSGDRPNSYLRKYTHIDDSIRDRYLDSVTSVLYKTIADMRAQLIKAAEQFQNQDQQGYATLTPLIERIKIWRDEVAQDIQDFPNARRGDSYQLEKAQNELTALLRGAQNAEIFAAIYFPKSPVGDAG